MARPNDPCSCGSGRKAKKCCATPAAANRLRERFLAAADLHQAGRPDEAEPIYLEILAKDPRHADALHYLGVLEFQRGNAPAAAERINAALEVTPGHPAYLCNLGNALKALGRFGEARHAFRGATSGQPGLFLAWYNWSLLEQAAGDPGRAAELAAQVVRVHPAFAEGWFHLGQLLHSLNRRDAADEAYREALRRDPAHARARENLAALAVARGEPEAAVEMLAPQIESGQAGFDGEAIDLMARLYLPHDPLDLAARHRQVMQRRYPDPGRPPAVTAGRRRIAYLSPDFCEHPVRFFVRPLLKHHDRERFEVFCYHLPCRADDAFTAEFRAAAGHWVDARGWSDDAVVRDLRARGIDVVVDLAGLTHGGRPGVLAARPAPLQLCMLGYLGPSGLAQVDGRITDAVACPPGAEAWFGEPVLRLPASQWCYVPDADAPPIVEPDGAPERPVRYGNLGHPAKINDAVAALWTRVLHAAGDAELVLAGTSAAARAALAARFARAGLAADRLRFLPFQPCAEYLASYLDIDVCLDTFPYTGGTTCCDALYMGTPVVTLPTASAVGRGGASVLAALGRREWIADSADAFTGLALALGRASRRPAAGCRQALRDAMRASPLMDARQYVADFEQLLLEAGI